MRVGTGDVPPPRHSGEGPAAPAPPQPGHTDVSSPRRKPTGRTLWTDARWPWHFKHLHRKLVVDTFDYYKPSARAPLSPTSQTMPGKGGSPPLDDPYAYKRPSTFPCFRLRREEAQADIALIKRLVREAKNGGGGAADSGGSKGTDSPRAQM
ncbi:MAG: hypothetical protein J3K34DRAFT_405206 [Monoraphidium minutum]|nr:MAG: hypothetical protein J3K34DRAFT_405206 [Monoraphidium minutum]